MDTSIKNNEENNLAASHLIYLAGCAVNEIIPDCRRIEEMDLETVYQLSRSCSLGALTFSALESTRSADFSDLDIPVQPFCESDQEVLRKWKKEKDEAIYKDVRFDLEREKVLAFLENAGIWYVPLKGIVIKDYYPEPWMRQEADNDILYDATYQKQVHQWFLERGYEAKQYKLAVEDCYLKEPCYNFEMHTSLTWRNYPKWFAYFDNIKERLVPDEGKTYAYHLSEEDFYVYFVIHGYRHYMMRGTGLRFLLDLYIYTKKRSESLNWERIHRDLTDLDAEDFEQQARKAAWKIFRDPEGICLEKLSEEEWAFLADFLFFGTYGTYEKWINTSLKEIDPDADKPTGWIKFKYVWHRAFPDAEQMAAYAPVFAKYKWLIPAGYVYRFLRSCRKYPGKIRSELKTVRKMT